VQDLLNEIIGVLLGKYRNVAPTGEICRTRVNLFGNPVQRVHRGKGQPRVDVYFARQCARTPFIRPLRGISKTNSHLRGNPDRMYNTADNESGNDQIAFTRRVHQGDHLRPLLFALVLQHVLQVIAAAHPAVHPIADADDTHLM
jgi:hypothetical protein